MVAKTDSDGRSICELFMRKPSAKVYPEYYVVIKQPIDLREIYQKIRNNQVHLFIVHVYILGRYRTFCEPEHGGRTSFSVTLLYGKQAGNWKSISMLVWGSLRLAPNYLSRVFLRSLIQ